METHELLHLLAAERAIRQTVLVMTRAFDDEDWATVRASLSEDFVASAVMQAGTNEQGKVSGADTIVDIMRQLSAQRRAAGIKYMHTLTDLIIDIASTEATVSAFQIAYLYPAGTVGSPSSTSGSRNTFRLRQEGEGWKITAFDVTRLWIQGEQY